MRPPCWRGRSMKDQDLLHLRRDIARLPNGRGRRFPPALRARVINWVAGRRTAGTPWNALEEELGISAVTLQAWAAARPDTTPPRLVPVEVHEDTPPVTVSLVSPTGWRVEGVPLARCSRSPIHCTRRQATTTVARPSHSLVGWPSSAAGLMPTSLSWATTRPCIPTQSCT